MPSMDWRHRRWMNASIHDEDQSCCSTRLNVVCMDWLVILFFSQHFLDDCIFMETVVCHTCTVNCTTPSFRLLSKQNDGATISRADRRHLRTLGGCMKGRIRLMTAVTSTYAHAYQVTCLTRHMPAFPCLNFRLPTAKARCPHLPSVRTTTRERGNGF